MYSVGFIEMDYSADSLVKLNLVVNFGLLNKSSLRVLPVGRVCFGILSKKTI